MSARLTSRWVTARIRLPAAVPMPTPRSLQASTSLVVVQPRIVMVLGKAIPVVLEGIDRCGGNHAGLAHRAAQHLLLAPGFLDEVLRARDAGADRRAQALGVVEPERVDAGCVVAGLGPGFD